VTTKTHTTVYVTRPPLAMVLSPLASFLLAAMLAPFAWRSGGLVWLWAVTVCALLWVFALSVGKHLRMSQAWATLNTYDEPGDATQEDP
jgi:hypothetical protein